MNSKSYIYMLIRDFQHNKTPIKYSVKKDCFSELSLAEA